MHKRPISAKTVFDHQYEKKGLASQRRYPNESLIQFLAGRYFGLPKEARSAIRVLEIGCGTGANLWMMAKEGLAAYGIDSSEKALQLARSELLPIYGVSAELRQASFAALPYDDDFFDSVVDVVSLQHTTLVDSANALSEIARVLKPTGTFFSFRLSDHSIMYNHSGGRRLDAATVHNIADRTMPLANNGPTSFWSPVLVTLKYAEAGLTVESIERIGRTHSTGAYVEYLSVIASLAPE